MNKIRYYREYYGISQRQLARRIGISYAGMSYIESNIHTPSVYVAIRISKVFKVPVEAIFFE